MDGPGIIILGGGESGVGAAILAKKKGFDVFLSDKGRINEKYKNALKNHGIKWEEEKHSEEKILSVNEIVKSPGIPDHVPIIKKARKKGIRIISEIEFAARYTDAYKICITGSNGKTTTTLLIYDILKRAGYHVGLAGNVGQSFAWQVAENDFDYYVLEISSFQLDAMFDFKAEIAVLLNITPDHLDRYENSFEKYTASKFRILQNQTESDHFIFYEDDPVIVQEIKKKDIKSCLYPYTEKFIPREGAYIKNNNLLVIQINKEVLKMEIKELALVGKHNVYNSMASGIAARLVDIRKEVIKQSLTEFENIEHRLEHVSYVKGIEFINDSKATNVNSAWYALESINKPIIWIMGGMDKGNDYTQLMELVKSKVKAIVCLGKDNSRVKETFSSVIKDIVETESAEDAVKAAYLLGEKGDVVLLSPACASFDLFENFEDRGRQFKKAVYDL
ncbi:MAG: UDP-N-acetylmuramoyl-L-alanine--D-glutamate ligase [Bacteroidetes bacterium]|nr:MAG: UDP-N-acetylmuramoyl-L-alanine--D-glutamate ligase [Bacteroidota bacterium]